MKNFYLFVSARICMLYKNLNLRNTFLKVKNKMCPPFQDFNNIDNIMNLLNYMKLFDYESLNVKVYIVVDIDHMIRFFIDHQKWGS